MRRKSTTLPELELEIMKIVWDHDTVTVRDVYETLLKRRKVAYTTVMTMMKILEQKKYLKKNQDDRAYVYKPVQPRRQVIGAMVRDFVNRVFNGSGLRTFARPSGGGPQSFKTRPGGNRAHEKGQVMSTLQILVQHRRLHAADDRPSGVRWALWCRRC